MSGPVSKNDAPDIRLETDAAPGPVLAISPSREAKVGTSTVRRFEGPERVEVEVVGRLVEQQDVGQGRQHEQQLEPALLATGQRADGRPLGVVVEPEPLHQSHLVPARLARLAGHGIAHSEATPDAYRDGFHGIQLWVAQPEHTRHGPAAFEHRAELPQVEIGSAVATVLLGDFAGADSPARTDTALVGADFLLPPGAHEMPLRVDFEHALIVLEGAVRVAEDLVQPGALAYLGTGRDGLQVSNDESARALLLGGEPFPEPILMWWNFVARTRDEIELATKEWNAENDRFGVVPSTMHRIPAPPVPWQS